MLLVVHMVNCQLAQVFHVRSVTQGDVIRADAKEIPRIFQACHFLDWLGERGTLLTN